MSSKRDKSPKIALMLFDHKHTGNGADMYCKTFSFKSIAKIEDTLRKYYSGKLNYSAINYSVSSRDIAEYIKTISREEERARVQQLTREVNYDSSTLYREILKPSVALKAYQKADIVCVLGPCMEFGPKLSVDGKHILTSSNNKKYFDFKSTEPGEDDEDPEYSYIEIDDVYDCENPEAVNASISTIINKIYNLCVFDSLDKNRVVLGQLVSLGQYGAMEGHSYYIEMYTREMLQYFDYTVSEKKGTDEYLKLSCSIQITDDNLRKLDINNSADYVAIEINSDGDIEAETFTCNASGPMEGIEFNNEAVKIKASNADVSELLAIKDKILKKAAEAVK